MIHAFFVKFRGCRIQRQHHILAGLVAGFFDGLHNIFERGIRGSQRWGKAPLITYAGGKPVIAQKPLQRVKNLSAHANAIRQCVSGNRHNHELLNIYRIVGMRAAIHNIHHRHRQYMCRNATNIAPKRCVL